MTQSEGNGNSLFAELRRRRVFRTLALYVLAAWGLMQVADVLLPALDLPEKSIRYLLFASIAGLPVALIFGWFFDITAHGIARTASMAGADVSEAEPLRSVDYLLLGALAVVLGLILYSFMGGVVEIPLADKAFQQHGGLSCLPRNYAVAGRGSLDACKCARVCARPGKSL